MRQFTFTSSGFLALVFVVGALGIAGTDFLTDPIQDLVGGGDETVLVVTTTPQPTVIPGCDVEDTTVTLSSKDQFTTAASSEIHRYTINGGAHKTLSDAGTFTASPGNSLQILYVNGSQGVSYFSAVATEVIPCQGTVEYTANLVTNGTMTIEVFNEGGNLISSSINETFAAGDVTTLDAKLKGTFQTGLPYGGVIVAEWNKSSMDDVIVNFGGSETSVPNIANTTYGSQSQKKAYTIPAFLSNEILVGSVVVDVDDKGGATVARLLHPNANDILLTLYVNDYFVNEDTGGSFDGPAVEDEDDIQIRLHNTAFILQSGIQ